MLLVKKRNCLSFVYSAYHFEGSIVCPPPEVVLLELVEFELPDPGSVEFELPLPEVEFPLEEEPVEVEVFCASTSALKREVSRRIVVRALKERSMSTTRPRG